jgi:molybdopterin-binding protein
MICIYKHIDYILIGKNKFIIGVENMKISARNILKGKVKSIEKGPITSLVKIEIESPSIVTAIISKESVEDLNIKIEDEVCTIIKSTEVIVAKED